MNVKKFLARMATAAALTAAAAAAQADTYQFTLTGAYNASWQLQSTVTPDEVYDGQGFILYDQLGFPGASEGYVDLYFYNASIEGGGLEIYDYYGDVSLMAGLGAQLYSGTEDSPTFNVGTYTLTQYQSTETYTLTITNISAVPEPASMALLLGGLGLVGAAAARRRRSENEDALDNA